MPIFFLFFGIIIGSWLPDGIFRDWTDPDLIYPRDLVTRNGGFGQNVECLNGKVLYAGPRANEMYNNVRYTAQPLLVEWQNCLESKKYPRGGYREYIGSEYVKKFKKEKNET